jgi:hypothetical protein
MQSYKVKKNINTKNKSKVLPKKSIIKKNKNDDSKTKPISKKKIVLLKKNRKLKPVPPVSKKDTITTVVDPSPVKKPSFEKMYFTADTEKAIIEFNNTTDDDIRNRIYETKIKASFEKLVENVFNTFKFTYVENGPLEMQKETVTHLVANINKYEEGKGKAFSYFSIVAKHYLIFHNNTNYKRFNIHVDISDTPSDTTVCLQSDDPHHKDTQLKEFMKLMLIYWENNLSKIFKKQRDLNIANSVIELFRNSDKIEAFNKKSLYLYIREMSSCKTQQITKVINKMKQYQSVLVKTYEKNGNIDLNNYSKTPSYK